MTRKEEIKLYLKERNIPFNSLEANSIIEGVEWADKTMLNRILKYLEAEHPTFFEHFGEEIRKVIEE